MMRTYITTCLKQRRNQLFSPIDIASLVVFRIAFGAIMLWEVWRYFDHNWIPRKFIAPVFHFKYYGFEWLHPWPGTGMYLHFILLGILAVGIMLGACYRLCTVLFFLGFTYLFLLDQTLYLNHFYLVSLLAFLLIFIPAHRAFSVDVLRSPEIRRATAPAWALRLLQFQVGIVYFLGGVAKLNSDWLNGNPIRQWLAARTDVPVLGPYLGEESMVWLFAYGGLIFDLAIIPILLWRPTRGIGFVLVLLFNLTNSLLFRIGIFPWMMIAAGTLFFSPDWPRRLFPRRLFRIASSDGESNGKQTTGPRHAVGLACMVLYVVIQITVPLRHYLYPGNVSWTEEGHRFAWHMKLRSKKGTARFYITDPATHRTWEANARSILSSSQYRKMSTHPDMVQQFCQLLADDFSTALGRRVEVRAHVASSLNGREPRLLIDPSVDLANEPRSLLPAKWILTLGSDSAGQHDSEGQLSAATTPDEP